MKTQSIKQFKGILVPLDPTDMSKENCIQGENIDVSIPGKLSNAQGYVKTTSTGLGYPIDSIHKIGSKISAVFNGTVTVL